MLEWGIASVPVILGLGVSAVTPMNQPWYASLDKAPWNPPSWVFGPVWTFLYILMGLAARKIFLARPTPPLWVWGLFGLQLALNIAWSPVFFGAKNPRAAWQILVLLVGAALATTIAFWRIDASAGAFLVPYMVWLLLALSLNTYIIKNNNVS